jgi:hypothetical protein
MLLSSNPDVESLDGGSEGDSAGLVAYDLEFIALVVSGVVDLVQVILP